MSAFFHTLIYDPLYNLLIFLIEVFPSHNVALAVILLTLLVKVVLFPLAQSTAKMQVKMKEIEPEVKRIREKYKDNKQEQALKTMELYREKGVKPLRSILLLFIQLPIIIALFFIFNGSNLPEINTDLLYSFTTLPEKVDMMFLGVIHMAERSLPLAVLAGVTLFIQARLSFPPQKRNPSGGKPSFQEEFARSMQLNMRYIFPVIIGVVAYTLTSAVALYFVVSNIFTIFQEWFVRKNRSGV